MSAPDISVVIATYNRIPLLRRLLQTLEQQTLNAARFEVIVVDDGSEISVKRSLQSFQPSYTFSVHRQSNQGAAAARNAGVQKAGAPVVVIVDDDMRADPHFLAAHLEAHREPNSVVLGTIASSANLADMPLFERFHARWLERFQTGVRRGAIPVRGVHLCTGNVSFPKALFEEVGALDESLPRSEDRDLGIRFEQSGAKLLLAHDAITVHDSDHASLDVWLERAYRYGISDRRIAQKYPENPTINPWTFIDMIHPISRPFMLATTAFHKSVPVGARVVMKAAALTDKLGLESVALATTTFAYGLSYFRGLTEDAGGTRQALGEFMNYRQQSEPKSPFQRFFYALREDYRAMNNHRAKYHGDEQHPTWRYPWLLMRKVGLQMTASIRLMHLLRELRIPGGAQVVSRAMRWLYGADVHWDASIAAGISIVHGQGLVIGHSAVIERGAILFHNVTLGEGIDPDTRAVGTPHLCESVHVGPGATLLGPITVGARSKIGAGAVLTVSVDANSLVTTGPTIIEKRTPKGAPSDKKRTA